MDAETNRATTLVLAQGFRTCQLFGVMNAAIGLALRFQTLFQKFRMAHDCTGGDWKVGTL